MMTSSKAWFVLAVVYLILQFLTGDILLSIGFWACIILANVHSRFDTLEKRLGRPLSRRAE